MGNRLHYEKTHIIEYGDLAMFSWEMENIASILDNHNCTIYGGDDMIDGCTAGGDFEVLKSDIKRMVDELTNTTDREECGLQVEDLIYFFKSALTNAYKDDDYIHFTWF